MKTINTIGIIILFFYGTILYSMEQPQCQEKNAYYSIMITTINKKLVKRILPNLAVDIPTKFNKKEQLEVYLDGGKTIVICNSYDDIVITENNNKNAYERISKIHPHPKPDQKQLDYSNNASSVNTIFSFMQQQNKTKIRTKIR